MKDESEGAVTLPSQIAALLILLLMFGVSFWVPTLPEGTLWTQWDKVIHAISGGAIAILFLPYTRSWRQLFVFVFIIGAIFELAEAFIVPMAYYKDADRYIVDTGIDLIVDVLGAMIAVQLMRFWKDGE